MDIKKLLEAWAMNEGLDGLRLRPGLATDLSEAEDDDEALEIAAEVAEEAGVALPTVKRLNEAYGSGGGDEAKKASGSALKSPQRPASDNPHGHFKRHTAESIEEVADQNEGAITTTQESDDGILMHITFPDREHAEAFIEEAGIPRISEVDEEDRDEMPVYAINNHECRVFIPESIGTKKQGEEIKNDAMPSKARANKRPVGAPHMKESIDEAVDKGDVKDAAWKTAQKVHGEDADEKIVNEIVKKAVKRGKSTEDAIEIAVDMIRGDSNESEEIEAAAALLEYCCGEPVKADNSYITEAKAKGPLVVDGINVDCYGGSCRLSSYDMFKGSPHYGVSEYLMSWAMREVMESPLGEQFVKAVKDELAKSGKLDALEIELNEGAEGSNDLNESFSDERAVHIKTVVNGFPITISGGMGVTAANRRLKEAEKVEGIEREIVEAEDALAVAQEISERGYDPHATTKKMKKPKDFKDRKTRRMRKVKLAVKEGDDEAPKNDHMHNKKGKKTKGHAYGFAAEPEKHKGYYEDEDGTPFYLSEGAHAKLAEAFDSTPGEHRDVFVGMHAKGQLVVEGKTVTVPRSLFTESVAFLKDFGVDKDAEVKIAGDTAVVSVDEDTAMALHAYFKVDSLDEILTPEPAA